MLKFRLTDQRSTEAAVSALRNGAIIAYPTEAVFGLGCDPSDESAVHRLIMLKRRSVSKGLIVIGAEFSHIRPYVDWDRLSDGARDQVLATWPGPNTWILPASNAVSNLVTGGQTSVAVRITGHEPAAALCRAFGGGLVSTSANISGQKPAMNIQSIQQHFRDTVDLVLDAPLGAESRPTAIRDAVHGAIVRS